MAEENHDLCCVFFQILPQLPPSFTSLSYLTIFNISALAGILLKSGNVYFFSEQFYFSDDLNNSDILFGSECKRESCRKQFNSSAMERASGNYPFVC